MERLTSAASVFVNKVRTRVASSTLKPEHFYQPTVQQPKRIVDANPITKRLTEEEANRWEYSLSVNDPKALVPRFPILKRESLFATLKGSIYVYPGTNLVSKSLTLRSIYDYEEYLNELDFRAKQILEYEEMKGIVQPDIKSPNDDLMSEKDLKRRKFVLWIKSIMNKASLSKYRKLAKSIRNSKYLLTGKHRTMDPKLEYRLLKPSFEDLLFPKAIYVPVGYRYELPPAVLPGKLSENEKQILKSYGSKPIKNKQMIKVMTHMRDLGLLDKETNVLSKINFASLLRVFLNKQMVKLLVKEPRFDGTELYNLRLKWKKKKIDSPEFYPTILSHFKHSDFTVMDKEILRKGSVYMDFLFPEFSNFKLSNLRYFKGPILQRLIDKEIKKEKIEKPEYDMTFTIEDKGNDLIRAEYKLSKEQLKAMHTVLTCKGNFLIHGGPGTGKTTLMYILYNEFKLLKKKIYIFTPKVPLHYISVFKHTHVRRLHKFIHFYCSPASEVVCIIDDIQDFNVNFLNDLMTFCSSNRPHVRFIFVGDVMQNCQTSLLDKNALCSSISDREKSEHVALKKYIKKIGVDVLSKNASYLNLLGKYSIKNTHFFNSDWFIKDMANKKINFIYLKENFRHVDKNFIDGLNKLRYGITDATGLSFVKKIQDLAPQPLYPLHIDEDNRVEKALDKLYPFLSSRKQAFFNLVKRSRKNTNMPTLYDRILKGDYPINHTGSFNALSFRSKISEPDGYPFTRLKQGYFNPIRYRNSLAELVVVPKIPVRLRNKVRRNVLINIEKSKDLNEFLKDQNPDGVFNWKYYKELRYIKSSIPQFTYKFLNVFILLVKEYSRTRKDFSKKNVPYISIIKEFQEKSPNFKYDGFNRLVSNNEYFNYEDNLLCNDYLKEMNADFTDYQQIEATDSREFFLSSERKKYVSKLKPAYLDLVLKDDCSPAERWFKYNTQLNKVVDSEEHIIKSLRRSQDILPDIDYIPYCELETEKETLDFPKDNDFFSTYINKLEGIEFEIVGIHKLTREDVIKIYIGEDEYSILCASEVLSLLDIFENIKHQIVLNSQTLNEMCIKLTAKRGRFLPGEKLSVGNMYPALHVATFPESDGIGNNFYFRLKQFILFSNNDDPVGIPLSRSFPLMISDKIRTEIQASTISTTNFKTYSNSVDGTNPIQNITQLNNNLSAGQIYSIVSRTKRLNDMRIYNMHMKPPDQIAMTFDKWLLERRSKDPDDPIVYL